MQNRYIERINRTFREDVLDAYQFDTLEQLRILCNEWQYKYNYFHPHKSLKRMSHATATKIHGGVNPDMCTNYEFNEIV
jgi:transposase InsO family protein